MTPLKDDFKEMLSRLLGGEGAERLCAALNEEPTVGVRLNPRKIASLPEEFAGASEVPWCKGTGYRLSERPQFTLMPLWHGGAFYVQEPASMVMSEVARYVAEVLDTEGVRWLDLCAAPGGKTTAALAALTDDALVVANEFDPRRASVLAENVAKWGAPNVVLTRGDTAWVRKMPEAFHVVAVDAPCSGEGMMRKEEIAREQWSERLIDQCASLQREILDNAWESLMPGGYLIYSTCTFNGKENEQQVRYLMEEYGAENITLPSFGAAESLDREVKGVRFMPHITDSEGLFMALLRKPGDLNGDRRKKKVERKKKGKSIELPWLSQPETFEFEKEADGVITAYPKRHADLVREIKRVCPSIVSTGVKVACEKGRDLVPAPELALCSALNREAFPEVELTREEALDYLRRGTEGTLKAIERSEKAARGYMLATYRGVPLGFVKYLGNRINNLYPAQWRLRIN